MTPRPVRYIARVTPVQPTAGTWMVRLELTDDTGTVVEKADIDAMAFQRREDAEAAGWQMIESWIRRITGIKS